VDPGDVPAISSTPVPDPLVGRTLGGFRITSLLASGGYGRVYEAEQVTLGRKAALKVTDPRTLNTPVKQKRFLREAEILARFAHPNIVQIYEAGRDGDDYFLAMEFVEGESLQARIDRGQPLSPREAWGVARAALAALARAHKEGVIHRDVKPGNLLLPTDGEAKLTDFGLAKDLGSASLTDPGIILGTPMYMSPEQAHGGEPDARSDLYSLGATLYHAMTGRPPMSDLDVARGTPISTEPPPPVSEAARGVPADFAAWLDRMLARDRKARFASAEEALAALPSPPPAGAATRPHLGRIAAAVTAACIIGAVAFLLAGPERSPSPSPDFPPAPLPPPTPGAKVEAVPRFASAQAQQGHARTVSSIGDRRLAWLAVVEFFPKDRRACAESLFEVARIDEQQGHVVAAARTYRRILAKYADQEEVCRRARPRLRSLSGPR